MIEKISPEADSKQASLFGDPFFVKSVRGNAIDEKFGINFL